MEFQAVSDKAPAFRGVNDGESQRQPVQPFQRKPKRFKKDGTPYKPRKGWGPYRSVPNERAAAFNLQLDVQNLQQQIHHLVTVRDVLRTETTMVESTEPSVVHSVRQFFNVFQNGAGGAKSDEQRHFLYNFTDTNVIFGSSLRGPEAVLNEMKRHSELVHWVRLKLSSYNVIKAENSVVVSTSASLRLQMSRDTIVKVFPRVMDDERLVSQLVDEEIETYVGFGFYFASEGKCCKLDVGVDLVRALARIVRNPTKLKFLLDRSLIGKSCILGVIDEPQAPERQESLERFTDALDNDYHRNPYAFPSAALSQATNRSFRDSLKRYIPTLCLKTVRDYYLAFANGFHEDDSTQRSKLAIAFQHDFLLHRFATQAKNDRSSASYVEERWRSLSESFEVLGFHQKNLTLTEAHARTNTCTIISSARYTLRVTPSTLSSVFPHVLTFGKLREALVGEVLTVPSEIVFTIHTDTGCILCIEERMDFSVALAKIVRANANSSSYCQRQGWR